MFAAARALRTGETPHSADTPGKDACWSQLFAFTGQVSGPKKKHNNAVKLPWLRSALIVPLHSKRLRLTLPELMTHFFEPPGEHVWPSWLWGNANTLKCFWWIPFSVNSVHLSFEVCDDFLLRFDNNHLMWLQFILILNVRRHTGRTVGLSGLVISCIEKEGAENQNSSRNKYSVQKLAEKTLGTTLRRLCNGHYCSRELHLFSSHISTPRHANAEKLNPKETEWDFEVQVTPRMPFRKVSKTTTTRSLNSTHGWELNSIALPNGEALFVDITSVVVWPQCLLVII